MSRDSFQQEIDNLVAGMLDLGRQVEASLESMVRAMEERDAKLAGKELGVDARYKARGADFDNKTIVLQARRAPVARDLRLLYTVRTVTNHLVRSGTLCAHICRAITETADSERNEDLEATLLEMARAARSVFGEGLDIFRHRDIERARDLQAKDDRVDLLYSEVLNLIVNPFDENGGALEWRMRAALMVHLSHRNLVRSFKALLKSAGLPQAFRLYDLRHTCATLLLSRNVHPTYVQELLGHASIALTLDTYSHVIPGMDGGTAGAIENALG